MPLYSTQLPVNEEEQIRLCIYTVELSSFILDRASIGMHVYVQVRGEVARQRAGSCRGRNRSRETVGRQRQKTHRGDGD